MKKNDNNNSLYDLKDIYDGDLKNPNERIPVFVDETSAEYDLLNRTDTIDKLYNAIIYSKSKHSYIIGLNGTWGHGKTTILKIVKRKILKEKRDEFICIDSSKYDPWSYKSPEAMIYDLCKVILFNVEGARKRKIKEICKNISYLLSDYAKQKHHINLEYIKNIFSKTEHITKTQKTINLMKKELERSEKSILIYIENIDRASQDKILMLFSMLGTILDLPKLIFIIAYDKNRLDEIFTNTIKINDKFINKIINQEISVPDIDFGLKENLYNRCFNNILIAYGVSQTNISDYEYISKFIINNINDLREFKRLVNSAFFLTFGSFQRITYSPDKLSLQIIKFLNRPLYEYIKQNDWFFSFAHNSLTITEQYAPSTVIGKLAHKADTKILVEKIYEEYPAYIDLLSSTYPLFKDAINIWI